MPTIKAGPVKYLRTPRYPTRSQAEADPDLLKKNVPKKWLRDKDLAAALAVALAAGSGCLAEEYAKTSVGCMIILPPVYISEEQALGIIKQDLAEYDVLLSDELSVIQQYDHLPIEVDAADVAKDIAVEYLSREDCLELRGGHEGECQIPFYPRFAEDLEAQVAASATATHFKVFYEEEARTEEQLQAQLREQIQQFVQWLQGQGVI